MTNLTEDLKVTLLQYKHLAKQSDIFNIRTRSVFVVYEPARHLTFDILLATTGPEVALGRRGDAWAAGRVAWKTGPRRR